MDRIAWLAVGLIVVDETDSGVARRLESFAAAPPPRYQGLGVDQLRQDLVAGTPDQVTERLREYLRSGADGLTFSVWGAGDLEPVALAGAAAGAAFD